MHEELNPSTRAAMASHKKRTARSVSPGEWVEGAQMSRPFLINKWPSV